MHVQEVGHRINNYKDNILTMVECKGGVNYNSDLGRGDTASLLKNQIVV